MRTFILIFTCLIFMGLQSCNKKTTTNNKAATTKEATSKVKSEKPKVQNTAKRTTPSAKEMKKEMQNHIDEYEKLLKDPSLSAQDKKDIEYKMKRAKEELQKLNP